MGTKQAEAVTVWAEVVSEIMCTAYITLLQAVQVKVSHFFLNHLSKIQNTHLQNLVAVTVKLSVFWQFCCNLKSPTILQHQ